MYVVAFYVGRKWLRFAEGRQANFHILLLCLSICLCFDGIQTHLITVAPADGGWLRSLFVVPITSRLPLGDTTSTNGVETPTEEK